MGSPLVVGVALYKFFWGVSLFSHYFTRADFNPVNCPILFLSSNFYKCSTGVWDNRDNLRILALIMCLRGRLRESLGFTLRIYILDPYIIFTANRIKCLGLINQPIHGSLSDFGPISWGGACRIFSWFSKILQKSGTQNFMIRAG